MWRNYKEMKEANVIGADKYFHCMANCQAASRGPGGRCASVVLSNLREDYGFWKGDPLGDSLADMEANNRGRAGCPYCKQTCSRYLVRGLNP